MTQSRKCILLVEDNPDDALMAVEALREFARTHEVMVVGDGADARDFLNAVGEFSHREACDTPDLVLLDMKLPKLGGLDLIKSMRSERRTRTVPVVVVTSSDEEGDVLGAYEMGANSYIRKPVNFDEFAHAIREISRYWLTVNRAPPKPPADPQSGLREL